MSLFYSKSTNSFFDSAIHGVNIPSDALEITEEQHQAVMQAQSIGYAIGSDEAGLPTPVLREGVAIRSAAYITAMNQITVLENAITARRRDEAILGIDNGWLAAQRSAIDVIRATLVGL